MDIKKAILMVVIILLYGCKSKKTVETTKTDSVINKVEHLALVTDSGKIETTEQIVYEFDTVAAPFITPDEAIRGVYKLKLKGIKVNRHIKEDKALQSLKIDKTENKAVTVEKTAVIKESFPCKNEILLLLGAILAIYLVLKKL